MILTAVGFPQIDSKILKYAVKFEIQREFCRGDLKLLSNYRAFLIREIRIVESKL